VRQTVPYYQIGWSIWRIQEDPNLDGQYCIIEQLPDDLFQGPCAEFLRWSRCLLRVSRVLEWGRNGTTPVESRKQITRIDDAMKRSYAHALFSIGYKAQDFFPTAWMLKVLKCYDEGHMAEFQDQEEGLEKHLLEKKTIASGSAYVTLRERRVKFVKGKGEGLLRLRNSFDVIGCEGNLSLKSPRGTRMLWFHSDPVINDDSASWTT
jgi:hypothetical protein